MKKKLLILLGMMMTLLITACSSGTAQNSSSSAAAPSSSEVSPVSSNTESTINKSAGRHKILIAYFSHSGNTRQLANIIQQQTGGDLFEIVPQDPYPADYNQTVERFRRERAENARPAIAGKVDNMADYDTVFIGYPNWGSDMPYVVRTFLEQYDFSGKTVIPFCTNGGGGFGNSVETLKELCPDATVLEGYQVNGRSVSSSSDAVAQWLNGLNLQNE